MVKFESSGMNHLHGSRKKLYGTVGLHPYMRKDFWNNPLNHFWEKDIYPEHVKEYYRAWIRKLNDAPSHSIQDLNNFLYNPDKHKL